MCLGTLFFQVYTAHSPSWRLNYAKLVQPILKYVDRTILVKNKLYIPTTKFYRPREYRPEPDEPMMSFREVMEYHKKLCNILEDYYLPE